MPPWGKQRTPPADEPSGNGKASHHRLCDCEALQVKNDWDTICTCRDGFTTQNPRDKICSRCIMGIHSWKR